MYKNSFSDDDINNAAIMMAKAFKSYPLMNYLYPNEKIKNDYLKYFFRGLLKHGRKYGKLISISRNMEGVIMILESEKANFGMKEIVSSGLLWDYIKPGIKFMIRANNYEKFQTRLYKLYTKNVPHMYCALLAVEPQLQGKGYSKVLMNEMFKIADRKNRACYLETYLEKNKTIYRKLGYELVHEEKVPQANIEDFKIRCFLKHAVNRESILRHDSR